MIGASLLFAAADRALTRAWTAVVDPEHAQPPRDMARIYAPGVLMKYLPGSIFQYVSRQVEGAKSGIKHKMQAKPIFVKIALHLFSSRSVAAACLPSDRPPVVAFVAAARVVAAALAPRWGARRVGKTW